MIQAEWFIHVFNTSQETFRFTLENPNIFTLIIKNIDLATQLYICFKSLTLLVYLIEKRYIKKLSLI